MDAILDHLSAISAALTLLTFVAAAIAVLTSRQARQEIHTFVDLNGDGKVTAAELAYSLGRIEEAIASLAGRREAPTREPESDPEHRTQCPPVAVLIALLIALSTSACGGFDTFYLRTDGKAQVEAGYGDVAPAVLSATGRSEVVWTPGTWPPVLTVGEGCASFAWLAYEVASCAEEP